MPMPSSYLEYGEDMVPVMYPYLSPMSVNLLPMPSSYLEYWEDMVPVLHEEDLRLVHDQDLDGIEEVVVAILLSVHAWMINWDEVGWKILLQVIDLAKVKVIDARLHLNDWLDSN